jgi:hypothetical protein
MIAMFFPKSRYAQAGTYTIRTTRGVEVTAVQLPVRKDLGSVGFHPRSEGQRPDQIAAHYLDDAGGFWRLCDAGNAIAPDALASRDLIAVPPKGR